MARSKRALWKRFGRISSSVIVACFFLPFFGVSCAGMDMVTASGADMVGGCRPGGLLMDAQDKEKAHAHGAATDDDDSMSGADSMSGVDMKIDNVDREPLAIVAMALCVALLALSFLSTRGALVGCMLLALAGLGSLGGLYVKMTKEISTKMADLDKKDPGATDPDSISLKKKLDKDADVDAGARYGLWIVALGLLGTAVVTGLALREKDQSAVGDGTT
jgi:hypothetical protein